MASGVRASRSSERARAEGDGARARLLDAAEDCFERYGPIKTTMEDVARAAELSRATVYRYFENRDALLLGVVEREARRTSRAIERSLRGIEDPGEYIVEGVVQSLLEIPKRPALSMLFTSDAVGATSRLVLRSDRLAAIALELVLPVIGPARERGQLRASVSVEVMIEWIFRILSSYLTVPSARAKGPEAMRELLQQMLLPALIGEHGRKSGRRVRSPNKGRKKRR